MKSSQEEGRTQLSRRGRKEGREAHLQSCGTVTKWESLGHIQSTREERKDRAAEARRGENASTIERYRAAERYNRGKEKKYHRGGSQVKPLHARGLEERSRCRSASGESASCTRGTKQQNKVKHSWQRYEV